MIKLTRREAMKTTALGLAGLVLPSSSKNLQGSVQSVPSVSDQEKRFLSGIRGNWGSKNAWIDFDNYNKLLVRVAEDAGVPYEEMVRSRRENITEALSYAFKGITPSIPDAYMYFGRDRDIVLVAIKENDFRDAAAILKNKFDTTYI